MKKVDATKIFLYPGSFDPITRGHADVIQKAVAVFGEENVKIVVMTNKEKAPFLPIENRTELVRLGFPSIEVIAYEGMLNDLIISEQCGAGHDVFIVRGLRNSTDFEYEQTVQAFTEVFDATTVYFTPDSENIRISSSFVRHLVSARVKEETIREYLPNHSCAERLYEMLGLGEWKWN